ncbi:hypothetical protein [Deinococcus sp. PEB2-67]
MTLYVDEARTPAGGGNATARFFTDGAHADLHHAAGACHIAKAAYRAPELKGAQVVRGGYYLVSPQQRRALIRQGAVPVTSQPRDLPLDALLIVARAEARVSASSLR